MDTTFGAANRRLPRANLGPTGQEPKGKARVAGSNPAPATLRLRGAKPATNVGDVRSGLLRSFDWTRRVRLLLLLDFHSLD
jgi:hypothetical protein